MDKLIIKGPSRLSGSVHVSPAKNAYLPILAAVLLNDKPIHFNNLPNLKDIRTMMLLLEKMGVKISKNENITTFDASKIEHCEATYDLVKTMRASILVLGPLLSRYKNAKVSLPGGCAIGARPIDIHLSNLEKMNVLINLDHGYVDAKTSGLKAAELLLSFPSVGATENLMMAAVFADGTTTIKNAALEPEIDDLANFLNIMGAKITGIGTSKLVIEGVKELKECSYQAIGDRIEAATYLIAGLATKSEMTVTGIDPRHLESVLDKLKEMGARFECTENSIKVYPSVLKGCVIDTAPFPGFPTDVQAQILALLTTVHGSSVVTEHIFENRFMHVPELHRMGAKITLKGNSAHVEGDSKLSAAHVMCTDLRASAALIIGALVAEGETQVHRVYHLDRGYDNLDQKLKDLGVNIERTSGSM